MFELGNVHNQTVYIFAETIENEAISQISNMANSPLGKDAHIAIMPDAHAGAGCTIGTTMKIHDKVCPNLVGVDVGCLDKDTEILTTSGWIKISEYCDESILIYDKNSDTAYFEKPLAYIKAPCDHFNYFVSKKGLNQMLSDEHKMLIWRGYRGRGYRQVIAQASDVFQAHNQNTKSDRAIKTTFQLQQIELPISDEMIRVLVMVSADGCIQHNKKKPMSRCAFHFKKSRKIQRAKTLLENAHISYRCYTGKDGSYYIYTSMPREVTKSLKQFYRASQRQLEILIDEIYHWDGTIDTQRNHKMFCSTDKTNADVIQFAHAVNGIRAGISISEPDRTRCPNFNTSYQVYETQNEYVGFPDYQFQQVPSQDGYKYCFTTSTGFFIIRRKNCISITGNCGVSLSRIAGLEDVPFDVLDSVIRNYVPHGTSVHEKCNHSFDFSSLRCWNMLRDKTKDRALRSMGTLGGGEVCDCHRTV